MRKALWPEPPTRGFIDDLYFPKELRRYLDLHGRLWVLATVGDEQQSSVQSRADVEFAVQCFRRICAIEYRDAERLMLEQLRAFFDRFTDIDPKSFAAPARAVRSEAVARDR